MTSPNVMRKSIVISRLTQESAKKLDNALMTEYCYSLDQLMELAGFSVASAIYEEFPPIVEANKDVCVVCGPGNNGGDGLVASRHLKHFGYNPFCIVPKPSSKTFYQNLLKQLKDLDIPILPSFESGTSAPALVVDAIFGFGFDSTSQIRSPFDVVFSHINSLSCPVISIDVPSGWDVDLGNTNAAALKEPDMLVSLTAPKVFTKDLGDNVVHYLGGRGFVPPDLQAQFAFTTLPKYPGVSQCVRI